MSTVPETDPDLAATIDQIMRRDRGRLLSALIRSLRDFDLAEDSLSDALERALVHWKRNGLPDRPDAWLLQTARRRAIDRIRQKARQSQSVPELEKLIAEDEADRAEMTPEIPDERLRLIFTCCHPALEEKTRVALTLRTIGGLKTREIARAFLDTETAMGQRLSRAKAKIAVSGIPYRVPEREDWDERLSSVLTVLYLIFNEGWTAGPGEQAINTDLCAEAIYLARLMTRLAPDEPEIEGLLALMLLSHARFAARLDDAGAIVPLELQNRKLWRREIIDEGLAMLDIAVARNRAGPFQVQAAINALHLGAEPGKTDWAQIVMLYESLYRMMPTAVIRLNRAVAMAELGELVRARSEIDALRPDLGHYQPFHAADAELACRANDSAAARAAFELAINLTSCEAEKAFLRKRQRTKLN